VVRFQRLKLKLQSAQTTLRGGSDGFTVSDERVAAGLHRRLDGRSGLLRHLRRANRKCDSQRLVRRQQHLARFFQLRGH